MGMAVKKNAFGFNEVLQQVKGNFKGNITKKVSFHSLLFFRTQYAKQGTNKDGFVAWKERKYKLNTKLLVKTGTMFNSMKLTSKRFEKIRIEVDIDYAQYHQNGTTHLPKREMLYDSKVLDKQVQSIIEKELAKLFR